MSPNVRWVLLKGVMFLLQYLRDLGNLGVTIGVLGGRVVIPLSAVRPCGRGHQEDLDMYGSLHQTIGYLIGWYKGDE
jgi:hypothetical protein